MFPCNADGTMMGDEDDDPFVEDPSELVSNKCNAHVDHSATQGRGEYELSTKDQGSCRPAFKI